MAFHMLLEDWAKAENHSVRRNGDSGGDGDIGFSVAIVFRH